MEASRPSQRHTIGLERRTAASLLVLTCLALGESNAAAGADDSRSSASPRHDSVSGAGGPWLSIGGLFGSTQPDGELADYQWDTTPRASFGVQALAGNDRFASGLRVWNTRTTQHVGIPDQAAKATVHTTSVELVGQAKLATAWRTEVHAIAGGGLLHIGYEPERITIDSGGTPIVVDLKALNEWVAGGGLALRRRLASAWSAGLELDYRIYGLDTAHRNGNDIEFSRETFGDWSARLELAWLYRRR